MLPVNNYIGNQNKTGNGLNIFQRYTQILLLLQSQRNLPLLIYIYSCIYLISLRNNNYFYTAIESLFNDSRGLD